MKFRRKLKQKSTERFNEGILSLFLQDFESQIIPYDFERNPNFHVTLHGDSNEIQNVIEFLRPISNDRPYREANELKGIVAGAIKTIGNELIRNGIANYKISPSILKLLPNSYDNMVVKRFGLFFSKTSFGNRFSREGFEYSYLNKKNIWSIKLPKSMCSYGQHKKIVAFLSRQKLGMPEYFLPIDNRRGFDVKEFSNLRTIATIKASKPWGWDGRKSLGNDFSEYYRLLLSIRQTRAVSTLRNHILSELSSYLQKLGFDVRIRVYGFPYADDLDELMKDLENGKIDFKTAYERKSSGYKFVSLQTQSLF